MSFTWPKSASAVSHLCACASTCQSMAWFLEGHINCLQKTISIATNWNMKHTVEIRHALGHAACFQASSQGNMQTYQRLEGMEEPCKRDDYQAEIYVTLSHVAPWLIRGTVCRGTAVLSNIWIILYAFHAYQSSCPASCESMSTHIWRTLTCLLLCRAMLKHPSVHAL